VNITKCSEHHPHFDMLCLFVDRNLNINFGTFSQRTISQENLFPNETRVREKVQTQRQNALQISSTAILRETSEGTSY